MHFSGSLGPFAFYSYSVSTSTSWRFPVLFIELHFVASIVCFSLLCFYSCSVSIPVSARFLSAVFFLPHLEAALSLSARSCRRRRPAPCVTATPRSVSRPFGFGYLLVDFFFSYFLSFSFCFRRSVFCFFSVLLSVVGSCVSASSRRQRSIFLSPFVFSFLVIGGMVLSYIRRPI